MTPHLARSALEARSIGVGVLDDIMKGSFQWVKIPSYYYSFRQLELPLHPDECAEFFDETISIFSHEPQRKTTNAATGLRLNEAFLALGVGVIASGEPESFALSGASFPNLADGTNLLLDSMDAGLTDPFLGALQLGDAPPGTNPITANFSWGTPTWRIIEKFIQNYRLQIVLNNRFEVTNESLFDLGMVWTFAGNPGTSSSRVAARPYIRAVNDVMNEKGIGQTFVPANRVVEGEDTLCLPTPNPQVSYGGPNIPGVANRMYSFAQPLLLVPGLRFQMDFIQASPPTAPTICDLAIAAPQKYAEQIGDAADNCTGITIPGGTVRLGLVLKGFALQPSAALHYLNTYMWRGSVMAEAISQGDHSPWLGALFSRYRHDQQKSALGSKLEEPIPWK